MRFFATLTSAAVVLVLAVAPRAAQAHTCYTDYISSRDAVVFSSSGVWGDLTFDIAAELSLCVEQQLAPLTLHYLTFEASQSATWLNEPEGRRPASRIDVDLAPYQYRAAPRSAEGEEVVQEAASTEKTHVVTGEDKEAEATTPFMRSSAISRVSRTPLVGVVGDEVVFHSVLSLVDPSNANATVVEVVLCPSVPAGAIRRCKADPAANALIIGIVTATLVIAAVVLLVSALNKAAVRRQTHQAALTLAHLDGRLQTSPGRGPQQPQHQRHYVSPEDVLAYARTTCRPAARRTARRGNVDAVSGLQRFMYVQPNDITGDPYNALLSRGGVRQRTLRFCVIQLLAVEGCEAREGSNHVVYLWVRKGRIGTMGKIACVRYETKAEGVYEFIGLQNQHVADGWVLRRGTTDHPAPKSAIVSRAPPAIIISESLDDPAAALPDKGSEADARSIERVPSAMLPMQPGSAVVTDDGSTSPVRRAMTDRDVPSDQGGDEAASATGLETPDAALRPFLGFSLLEHTEELDTLTVDALWAASPAAVAGLAVGDIVRQIEGQTVCTLADAREAILANAFVGRPLEITYVSGTTGESVRVAIIVGTLDAAKRGSDVFYDQSKFERTESERRVRSRQTSAAASFIAGDSGVPTPRRLELGGGGEVEEEEDSVEEEPGDRSNEEPTQYLPSP